MPEPFALLLRRHLRARGLTQTAFAQQLGLHKTSLHAFLAGKAPLPMQRIPAFADALGLERAEREAFLLAAYLTRSPPQVAEAISRIELEVATLRAQVAALGNRATRPRSRSSRRSRGS